MRVLAKILRNMPTVPRNRVAKVYRDVTAADKSRPWPATAVSSVDAVERYFLFEFAHVLAARMVALSADSRVVHTNGTPARIAVRSAATPASAVVSSNDNSLLKPP